MSYGILTPNGLSYEKAYHRDETFRKLKNYKSCIRNYVTQDGANSGWMRWQAGREEHNFVLLMKWCLY